MIVTLILFVVFFLSMFFALKPAFKNRVPMIELYYSVIWLIVMLVSGGILLGRLH